MTARFGAKLTATVSMVVVAAALAAYAFMDAGTPVLVIEIVFFVQGAAMANIMPPATTAIMESMPREKAGVGSAMSNTVRQVAGALGVALLGSLLSATYRDEITLAGGPAGGGAAHGRRIPDRHAGRRRRARRARRRADRPRRAGLPGRHAHHGPGRRRDRPRGGPDGGALAARQARSRV
nr:hypothetical protein GCM10020093_111090 [Planobispora longispora]